MAKETKGGLGLTNMNGMSADDDRTCALTDMNCLEGQPEQVHSLTDINAQSGDDSTTCALTDMNCQGE